MQAQIEVDAVLEYSPHPRSMNIRLIVLQVIWLPFPSPLKKQSPWTPEHPTHAPLPWCRNQLPVKRLSSCSLTMIPWVSSACLLCTAHQALCQPDLCREVQVIDTLQPWQTELIHHATLWHSVTRMIQKPCTISSNDQEAV